MIEEGDRVELVYTSDEYTNLEPGDTGTVTSVREVPPALHRGASPKDKYWVDWDDGGKLAMIEGEDEIKRIE